MGERLRELVPGVNPVDHQFNRVQLLGVSVVEGLPQQALRGGGGRVGPGIDDVGYLFTAQFVPAGASREKTTSQVEINWVPHPGRPARRRRGSRNFKIDRLYLGGGR